MQTVKLPSGEVIQYEKQGGTESNPVYYNTTTIEKAPTNIRPWASTTPTTTSPTTTQTSQSTIGDLYGTNNIDSALKTGADYYSSIANQTEKTPEQIFEEKRKLYQAEIDAVDRIYADKIKQARIEGQGRLGSSTAVQARSGLLGSDFGQAQTEKVMQGNRDIEDAYLNEKAVQINTILGKARQEALDEAKAKTEAKQAGIKSFVEYLTAQDTRKSQRLTNLAKSMIAQGLDITKLTPQELSQLQTSYGATKDEILSTFNTEKLASEKLKADLAKNQPDTSFTLSQGQERFVLDPKTGQYVKVASTAKTYAPSSTVNTTGGQYANDLDAVIGATLATIPSKFGQQTFQSEIKRARNDGDKINLIASQVLKGASAEIRNDFSNQAIAMKQLDKAIAELDAGVKSGFLNSKAQYVAGVFGKDFDPKLQKVQGLITSAIQPYRASVTGAAWGTQEDAEYADLFGSTKYSPTELKNRLVNMKETLKSKSATALNTFVNPLGTYGNQFEIGSLAPSQQNEVVDTVLSEFGL